MIRTGEYTGLFFISHRRNEQKKGWIQNPAVKMLGVIIHPYRF